MFLFFLGWLTNEQCQRATERGREVVGEQCTRDGERSIQVGHVLRNDQPGRHDLI